MHDRLKRPAAEADTARPAAAARSDAREPPPISGSRQSRPVPAPSREELAACEHTALVRTRGAKPDLTIVDHRGCRMVIKDYARRPWWVRVFGRVVITIESRAYRWLGQMPGLPTFHGQIDRLALAVEWIDGWQLYTAPNRFKDRREIIRQLRRITERFTAAGFLHLDLRGRHNAVVGRDGRVVAIDLAGSCWLRPEGRAFRLTRWVYRWHYNYALRKFRQQCSAFPLHRQVIRRRRGWFSEERHDREDPPHVMRFRQRRPGGFRRVLVANAEVEGFADSPRTRLVDAFVAGHDRWLELAEGSDANGAPALDVVGSWDDAGRRRHRGVIGRVPAAAAAQILAEAPAGPWFAALRALHLRTEHRGPRLFFDVLAAD